VITHPKLLLDIRKKIAYGSTFDANLTEAPKKAIQDNACGRGTFG
jgi:hypothetical protein